jgi:hypothetical protein
MNVTNTISIYALIVELTCRLTQLLPAIHWNRPAIVPSGFNFRVSKEDRGSPERLPS